MTQYSIQGPLESPLKKGKLVTVDFYQTIEDALKLMSEHSVHHLIVLREDTVYGVVSDREIYRALTQSKPQNKEDALLASVGFCCTEATALPPGTTLKEACEQMIKTQCSGLAITDKGQPLGIITTTDMVQVLYHSLANDGSGEPDVLNKGQVALSHPLMVNLMQILSEAGI